MKSSFYPSHVNRSPLYAAVLGGVVAVTAPALVSASGEANPWPASKSAVQGGALLLAAGNPCQVKKAGNPCNPCAVKKAPNPCNPCAVKKTSNPCNPCAVKK